MTRNSENLNYHYYPRCNMSATRIGSSTSFVIIKHILCDISCYPSRASTQFPLMFLRDGLLVYLFNLILNRARGSIQLSVIGAFETQAKLVNAFWCLNILVCGHCKPNKQVEWRCEVMVNLRCVIVGTGL